MVQNTETNKRERVLTLSAKNDNLLPGKNIKTISSEYPGSIIFTDDGNGHGDIWKAGKLYTNVYGIDDYNNFIETKYFTSYISRNPDSHELELCYIKSINENVIEFDVADHDDNVLEFGVSNNFRIQPCNTSTTVLFMESSIATSTDTSEPGASRPNMAPSTGTEYSNNVVGRENTIIVDGVERPTTGQIHQYDEYAVAETISDYSWYIENNTNKPLFGEMFFASVDSNTTKYHINYNETFETNKLLEPYSFDVVCLCTHEGHVYRSTTHVIVKNSNVQPNGIKLLTPQNNNTITLAYHDSFKITYMLLPEGVSKKYENNVQFTHNANGLYDITPDGNIINVQPFLNSSDDNVVRQYEPTQVKVAYVVNDVEQFSETFNLNIKNDYGARIILTDIAAEFGQAYIHSNIYNKYGYPLVNPTWNAGRAGELYPLKTDSGVIKWEDGDGNKTVSYIISNNTNTIKFNFTNATNTFNFQTYKTYNVKTANGPIIGSNTILLSHGTNTCPTNNMYFYDEENQSIIGQTMSLDIDTDIPDGEYLYSYLLTVGNNIATPTGAPEMPNNSNLGFELTESTPIEFDGKKCILYKIKTQVTNPDVSHGTQEIVTFIPNEYNGYPNNVTCKLTATILNLSSINATEVLDITPNPNYIWAETDTAWGDKYLTIKFKNNWPNYISNGNTINLTNLEISSSNNKLEFKTNNLQIKNVTSTSFECDVPFRLKRTQTTSSIETVTANKYGDGNLKSCDIELRTVSVSIGYKNVPFTTGNNLVELCQYELTGTNGYTVSIPNSDVVNCNANISFNNSKYILTIGKINNQTQGASIKLHWVDNAITSINGDITLNIKPFEIVEQGSTTFDIGRYSNSEYKYKISDKFKYKISDGAIIGTLPNVTVTVNESDNNFNVSQDNSFDNAFLKAEETITPDTTSDLTFICKNTLNNQKDIIFTINVLEGIINANSFTCSLDSPFMDVSDETNILTIEFDNTYIDLAPNEVNETITCTPNTPSSKLTFNLKSTTKLDGHLKKEYSIKANTETDINFIITVAEANCSSVTKTLQVYATDYVINSNKDKIYRNLTDNEKNSAIISVEPPTNINTIKWYVNNKELVTTSGTDNTDNTNNITYEYLDNPKQLKIIAGERTVALLNVRAKINNIKDTNVCQIPVLNGVKSITAASARIKKNTTLLINSILTFDPTDADNKAVKVQQITAPVGATLNITPNEDYSTNCSVNFTAASGTKFNGNTKAYIKITSQDNESATANANIFTFEPLSSMSVTLPLDNNILYYGERVTYSGGLKLNNDTSIPTLYNGSDHPKELEATSANTGLISVSNGELISNVTANFASSCNVTFTYWGYNDTPMQTANIVSKTQTTSIKIRDIHINENTFTNNTLPTVYRYPYYDLSIPIDLSTSFNITKTNNIKNYGEKYSYQVDKVDNEYSEFATSAVSGNYNNATFKIASNKFENYPDGNVNIKISYNESDKHNYIVPYTTYTILSVNAYCGSESIYDTTTHSNYMDIKFNTTPDNAVQHLLIGRFNDDNDEIITTPCFNYESSINNGIKLKYKSPNYIPQKRFKFNLLDTLTGNIYINTDTEPTNISQFDVAKNIYDFSLFDCAIWNGVGTGNTPNHAPQNGGVTQPTIDDDDDESTSIFPQNGANIGVRAGIESQFNGQLKGYIDLYYPSNLTVSNFKNSSNDDEYIKISRYVHSEKNCLGTGAETWSFLNNALIINATELQNNGVTYYRLDFKISLTKINNLDDMIDYATLDCKYKVLYHQNRYAVIICIPNSDDKIHIGFYGLNILSEGKSYDTLDANGKATTFLQSIEEIKILQGTGNTMSSKYGVFK